MGGWRLGSPHSSPWAILARSWQANKATICVLASQVLATLVNATAKYLESDDGNRINPIQILHLRMLITAILCVLVLAFLKNSTAEGVPKTSLPPERRLRALVALRALAGVCGVMGFYYSLIYLPLMEATALNLLAPLGACCLVACIHSAPFGKREKMTVFACFLGALLITKPSFLFDFDTSVDGRKRAAGAVFALIGASGGSVSCVCVRIIGPELHPILVVKYFAISVLCITSLVQLANVRSGSVINVGLGSVQLVLTALTGVFGFAMECLLSLGLSLDPTSRATQAIYVQTVLSLAFDVLVWKVTPDILSVLGCFVVLISNVVVAQNASGEVQPKSGSEQHDIEMLLENETTRIPDTFDYEDDVVHWDLGCW